MRSDFNKRIALFQILFGILLTGVVIRVMVIQASPEGALFREMGQQSAWSQKVLKPERGRIYDRAGNMLAGNKIVYEVAVTLNQMQDPQTVAMTLSNILARPYDEIFTLLANQAPEQVYLVIDQFASKDQGDQLIALRDDPNNGLDLRGLEVFPRLARSYPNGSLASNVLGFVLMNNDGNYGVEEEYDSQLAGTPITVLIPNDPTLAGDYPNPPKGTDLILTIDRNIQAMVEKLLAQKVAETGAERGTIIVMDPKTGEILAMANTPQLDLNNYNNFMDMYPYASDFNVAVSTQYEPGSVFKVLTMAAALDSGMDSPGTTYMDTGYYTVQGVNIFNWDRGAWGVQDMTGCLQNSLNVCMAMLAEQMGPDTFYGYMRNFGIGHETGVDIAVEAAGAIKDPSNPEDLWIPLDMAVNSFGQGLAVSPMQMLAAASAVANEGKMVTPHVVKAMVSNGVQVNTSVQSPGSPISAETARTLSSMLANAMEGNDSPARLEGYRIAGKTGTASIPGPDGNYDATLTNQSFLGWGPIDDPRFMVYIWFEKPTVDEWASIVVAPVFHDLAQSLVMMMDLPPDAQRLRLLSGAGQ